MSKKTFFSLVSSKSNISTWTLISNPIKMLFNNGQSFLRISIPTILLLTICSVLFGRSTICSAREEILLNSPFCSDSALTFYINTILRILIILFFAIKWQQFAIQKQSITLNNILNFNKYNLKALGIMALFMIINIAPLPALAILYLHTPYENWKIELLYFTSIAWIFLLPIIAIRFYSIVSFALNCQQLPSIKKVWQVTDGNTLKLLLSTAFIVFLALFLFMQYYGAIMGVKELSIFDIIISQIEHDLFIVVFATLCINYCETQKDLLFAGESNEQ